MSRSWWTEALERHQALRERGVPAVSVLIGTEAAARARLGAWAAVHGRAWRTLRQTQAAAVLRACLDELRRDGTLLAAAVAAAAACTGRPEPEVRAVLGGGPSLDRERLLEALEAGDPDSGAGRLAREALEEDASDSGEQRVGRATDEDETSAEEAARALAELVPPVRWPAVLLAPEANANACAWLEAAASTADALLEAVPRLTLALAVEPRAWAAYLRTAPERRAKALLRGGAILLEAAGTVDAAASPAASPAPPAAVDAPHAGKAPQIEALRRRLGPDAEHVPDATLQALVALGPAPRLEQRLLEAATALRAPEAAGAGAPPHAPEGPGAAAEDRARSAAERFLFELLERLPQTAGRFELNGWPGFDFGGRAAEIDLWCPGLRLAVELDGPWHFQGPDAYRRDRRKDLLLQQHGCLVLRFLASDAVERLDAICGTILAAVAWLEAGRTAPEAGRPDGG